MRWSAGSGPESPRWAGAPRGLVFVVVLALALGLAVSADSLVGSSARLPSRTPFADATSLMGPTRTDSSASPRRVETALPAIGGLALMGHRGDAFLTRSDPAAVAGGAWTVVVRQTGGSLGRGGAVVTYPAPTNDFTDIGAPIRVGSVTGTAGRGFILWPLGNGHARIRGDLPQADLVHIAEFTMLLSGLLPEVRPTEGFRVIARGPSRLPLIHEVRYSSADLGLMPALGDGLIYTGMTSGGGFEDALYAAGVTPAGTVHGSPAVLSSVEGGNATLAWEPYAGVVAYVGWSGAEMSTKAITALRALAASSYTLTPSQWLATKPDLVEQENDPTG
jgi:hypothetical protein